jgi:hypothetical protein
MDDRTILYAQCPTCRWVYFARALDESFPAPVIARLRQCARCGTPCAAFEAVQPDQFCVPPLATITAVVAFCDVKPVADTDGDPAVRARQAAEQMLQFMKDRPATDGDIRALINEGRD